MLSSVGSTNKKFNLLFLEEGEHYIQDFFGKVRYYDFYSNMYRAQDVTLHFCSRSVIVEFKDSTKPLFKYLIKNFSEEPGIQMYELQDKDSLPMSIHCSKLVEVQINSVVPKPYLIHEARKIDDLPNKRFDLNLNI